MTEKNVLNIVYQDRSIVVVEKPGGLLAVPGRGPDKQDCVVHKIKTLFQHCIKQPSVHRLDMHTSGLMVLGLTREAHRNLSIQFEKRSVKKQYTAVLDGVLTKNAGTIELSFRLDPDNRPYQIYDPVHGKPGITLWKKQKTKNKKTTVAFTPITGRTHQLRIHAAHKQGLSCPIVGDQLYGKGSEGEKLLLHACFLSFQHPDTDKKMEFHSLAPF